MTAETTTRNMTLVNVTSDIFGNASDGPVYMWQLEELLAEWNAEGVAYGDLDPEDLPHLVMSGDEIRYYKSNTPGDFEIVGTIIELEQTFIILYDRMVATSTPKVYQRKAAWGRRELGEQPETQDWPFENAALFGFYQDARNEGLSHDEAMKKARGQIR